MRLAKLWLGVFGAGFAVIVAMMVLTLFTRIPAGALTRIGQVSEHDFEPLRLPPPIDFSLIRQAPIDRADVLVIGDSFSHYFAWQSVLVAAGYPVATVHWDKVPTPCGDIGAWLQSAGFRGRLVLIESIEFLLPERLEAMRHCKSMGRQPFAPSPTPTTNPSHPPAGFALNTGARLTSGLVTYLHTREVRKSRGLVTFEAGRWGSTVFASPVQDGCQQFSSRICDKSLFLEIERTTPELTAADADFMARFSAQARPLTVRWMVIPNKTTVYLDTGRNAAFVARAQALGIGPDLFTPAQTARRDIQDLYWPHDNHWSMAGQLYFGGRMLDDVRAAIGPSHTDALK